MNCRRPERNGSACDGCPVPVGTYNAGSALCPILANLMPMPSERTPASQDASTAPPDDYEGEYPFVGRFLDLEAGRLHYVDEGTGPILLFVHGNPTWSFAWRNFIKELSPFYRCIAVDHLGCGRSDKPQEYEYTLANHVANLTSLIDALDLQEVTLIGHDWGGCIGMGAAVARPEQFRQFVLANTAAFRSTRIPLRIAICRVPVVGAIAVRGCNGFARAAQWMAVTRRLPAAVRRGYLAPYNSWANRIATHEFVRDIPLAPSHRSYGTLVGIEQRLAQFADRRMLLCWGERDWCFTLDFLAEWQRRFPHAEVERYPQANHYVFEDAREAMIARVRTFLEPST